MTEDSEGLRVASAPKEEAKSKIRTTESVKTKATPKVSDEEKAAAEEEVANRKAYEEWLASR